MGNIVLFKVMLKIILDYINSLAVNIAVKYRFTCLKGL